MQLMLLMVRKDLLRQLRSPMGLLFALAFPIIFATLIALTFGTGSQPSVPQAHILVQDLDGSFLSGALLSATGNEQMAKYFKVEQVGDEGLQRLENNEASALWRIPANFQQDLLDGKPVEFELIRNPAQSILPEIAEQGLAVLSEVLSSAARILREPLDELRPMLDAESAPGALQVAALSVSFYEIVERAEGLLAPPAIALEAVQLTDEEGKGAGTGGATGSMVFLLVLPGISVWGLFLVGDIAMRDIMVESRMGTLRRQLSGPVSTRQVIVSKALYTALISLISLFILAAIGWFVARQTVDPLGFVLLSLALIMAITGYSAMVYGGTRTVRQGATISGILMLIFAFLGGAFIQLQSFPPTVRRIAPISPFFWGNSGYQDLLQADGGVSDILPNVGVLAGLGVLLLGVGAALLQRRLGRGTV